MIGIFDPISDFSKRNAPVDYQSQRSLTLSFVYREKKKILFSFCYPLSSLPQEKCRQTL